MFMRLFCCTAVVTMTAASMLHADALIPFATTKCTLNGVAAPCEIIFAPPLASGAFVDAQTSFPYLIVSAGAGTNIASGLTSASSFIKMDMWATTAGPVRAGFIDFVCGPTAKVEQEPRSRRAQKLSALEGAAVRSARATPSAIMCHSR